MVAETLVGRRDLEFQLFKLLDAQELTTRERFAEHSPETFRAAIDTAAAIALD